MKYRAEIDGLRALAVVPVILFHAGFELFSGGYVGVDIFFVISGYLITTIILNEMEEEKFSLINFYERRARRILPALFFVILVCIPFACLWLTPNYLKDFAHSLVAVATFSSNILFWQESGYFDTTAELKPLLHTWSLAVEEQYYLLFPPFLMIVWRFGKKAILITLVVVFAVSFATAYWGAYNSPSATFFLLPTRGWEILLGAFCSFYLRKQREKGSHWQMELASLIGFSLIAFAVLTFNKATPTPSQFTLIPTLGAALIILTAKQGTYVSLLLSSAPFVGVGLISYSAYLWHQPLLAFLKYLSFYNHGVIEIFVVFLLTAIFSLASYSWVEKPFRKKNAISRTKIFTLSICLTLVVIVSGMLGHIFEGKLSKDYDTRTNALLSAIGDWEYPNGFYKGPYKSSFVSHKESEPKIIFFGDSHAEQYGPLVTGFASQGMLRPTLFLTGGGCPPIPKVFEKMHPHCSDLIDRFEMALADHSSIDTVIIAACFNCYFIEQTIFPMPKNGRYEYFFEDERGVEAFRGGEGKKKAIEEFKEFVFGLSKHYEVVVVLDNPYSDNFDPKVSLLFSERGWSPYFEKKYPHFSPDKFFLDEVQISLTNELKREISRLDVTLVDPTFVICPFNQCKASNNDGQHIYSDRNHIRPFFVETEFRMLDKFLLQ